MRHKDLAKMARTPDRPPKSKKMVTIQKSQRAPVPASETHPAAIPALISPAWGRKAGGRAHPKDVRILSLFVIANPV